MITDDFKHDITHLIDNLFSPPEDRDDKMYDDFMEGFAPHEIFTPAEGMFILSKAVAFQRMIPVLVMIADGRNIPMKQFGVLFRRILRERIATHLLSQVQKIDEENSKI